GKIGLREPGEHTSGPNLASRDNVAHNQNLYTILETLPPVIPLCRKQAQLSPEATRRSFNKRFLLDLAEDWQQHGREGFKRGRREWAGGYLKVCAMLVAREMKLEHSGGVKAMTDEQLERTIEIIQAMIAAKVAGANAKVIEGEAEVPSLPAPGSGGTKMK